MTRRYIVGAVSLVAAFAIGVISSNFLMGTWWLVRGNIEVRCVGKTVCVGVDEDTALRFLDTSEVGGLAYLFCPAAPEANQFLMLHEVVPGKRCATDDHDLVFSHQTVETRIRNSGGKISMITEGPAFRISFP